MEVRDGSLEKGSVDLVMPQGNALNTTSNNAGPIDGILGTSIDASHANMTNNHNTISYNDNADSFE